MRKWAWWVLAGLAMGAFVGGGIVLSVRGMRADRERERQPPQLLSETPDGVRVYRTYEAQRGRWLLFVVGRDGSVAPIGHD